MVKKFRGKVKIADVQNEFDKLVNKINSLDARINKVSTDKENIDWRFGNDTLSPANYTLTIGGLKQALNNFDGAVYGARAFKTDSTHFKMTDGLLISKYGGFRLPDSILSIPATARTLYYDISNNTYKWDSIPSGSAQVIDTFEVVNNLVKADSIRNTDSNGVNIPADMYVLQSDTSESLSLGSPTVFDFKVYNANADNNTQELLSTNKISINAGDYYKIPIDIGDNNVNFRILRNSAYYANNDIRAKLRVLLGNLSSDGATFTPYYIVGHNGNGVNSIGLTDISIPKDFSIQLDPDSLRERYIIKGNVDTIGRRDISGTTYSNVCGCNYSISYSQDNNSLTVSCDYLDYLGNSLVASTLELNTSDIAQIVINNEEISSSRLTEILNDAASNMSNINCAILVSYEDNIGIFDSVDTLNDNIYSLGNEDRTWEYTFATPRIAIGTTSFQYYKTIPVGDTVYKICEISPQRDSLYLNDIQNVQVEDIYGTYEVAVQNRVIIPLVNYSGWQSLAENINNSTEPKFVCAIDDNTEHAGHSWSIAYFDGKEISKNIQPNSQTMNSWHPMNYLYLPKGAPNPFTYNIPQANATKVFKVIINKNIKG